MRIGFDAKRFFLNTTGLGNYSRTLLSSLACRFPEHKYYLFTPKTSPSFSVPAIASVKTIRPARLGDKIFFPAWRSKFVTGDLKKEAVDIYHGLSNEIPFGIHRLPIKTVVTVHDLIFERFPRQYNPIDVLMYRKKVQYACRYAHCIIAVSHQTCRDLITYYDVPPEKIRVVYQSCDPVFAVDTSSEQKQCIRKKYRLPAEFLLYVGSVTERKNLLTLIRAIKQLPGNLPLVVVGSGRQYKKKVKGYLLDHDSGHQVIWLCEQQAIPQAHLAMIYRLAKLLIYPSLFEGFGLPIQEALWSGTPVITSRGSCFLETGGNAALYVNPYDANALAEAIQRVCSDECLAAAMKQKGLAYAQKFATNSFAHNMMNIYKELLT